MDHQEPSLDTRCSIWKNQIRFWGDHSTETLRLTWSKALAINSWCNHKSCLTWSNTMVSTNMMKTIQKPRQQERTKTSPSLRMRTQWPNQISDRRISLSILDQCPTTATAKKNKTILWQTKPQTSNNTTKRIRILISMIQTNKNTHQRMHKSTQINSNINNLSREQTQMRSLNTI